MLSLKFWALLLSLTPSLTLAAPVNDVSARHLAKRGDGTRQNPKVAVFKIDGWTDLAEINCYIMLCLLKTSVFQRGPDDPNWGEQQFKEGGGKNEPFHDDKLRQYGTTRASANMVSPEDFPWRSTRLQPGQHRYLTGGPQDQQSVQGGCITNGYKGNSGGEQVLYDEWFEVQISKEDAHLMGEMCKAWIEDDLSKCGDGKKFNILGAVGVILSQMIYYYVRSEGRYYHATQKGSRRDLEAVQYGVDLDNLTWPEVPPNAEEVKRAVILHDEAGNELARAEKRAIVELDEAGNELSSAGKRGIVELDEAGNELSNSNKRGIVELDESGNELSISNKRGIVELDEAGNELSSANKRGIVELDESGNELSNSGKREVVETNEGEAELFDSDE